MALGGNDLKGMRSFLLVELQRLHGAFDVRLRLVLWLVGRASRAIQVEELLEVLAETWEFTMKNDRI
jgi:hypothetical protein